MNRSFTTKTAEETEKLAERLLPDILNKRIVLLSGPLGSGKTTFVKGLAKALGIQDLIKSPTYTYLNTYSIRPELLNNNPFETIRTSKGGLSEETNLVSTNGLRKDIFQQFPKYLEHFDLYRLPEVSENPEHVKASIGLEEALNNPHALVVIEWPERLPIEGSFLRLEFEKGREGHLIRID